MEERITKSVKMKHKISTIIFIILLTISILILSFLATSALIYGICWAFKITFAWRYAFGIWIVLFLIAGLIK